MNIGIVGIGRIGKLHFDNIISNFHDVHVTTIADPYFEGYYGGIKVTKSADEVIESKHVDIVLVTSPAHNHFEHVIRCIEEGKPVFCEKPLATTEKEITEIGQKVEEKKLLLQVGFNRRSDKNFRLAHEKVKAGTIGKIEMVNIISRDPEPPGKLYLEQNKANIFHDMTIHDFDMARFITMSEVSEVYAQTAVLIDEVFAERNDADTANVLLKFTNGVLGVITNSRRTGYAYDQRLEVYGANGTIQVDNIKSNLVSVSNSTASCSALPTYFFIERYKQAYLDEVANFLDAIRGKIQITVTWKDALQALKIANAATKSMNSNRPVKIL